MRPLLLAPLLLLAACGGSDGPSVDSAQDVADMIGCSDFKPDDPAQTELFVTESGFCKIDGEQVTAYYFGSDDAQDSYVEAASAFGGLMLVGDGWAVSAPRAILDALAEDVGGEVTP